MNQFIFSFICFLFFVVSIEAYGVGKRQTDGIFQGSPPTGLPRRESWLEGSFDASRPTGSPPTGFPTDIRRIQKRKAEKSTETATSTTEASSSAVSTVTGFFGQGGFNFGNNGINRFTGSPPTGYPGWGGQFESFFTGSIPTGSPPTGFPGFRGPGFGAGEHREHFGAGGNEQNRESSRNNENGFGRNGVEQQRGGFEVPRN